MSVVASIQEGSITIGSGSTSNTATITAVVTGKSSLEKLGVSTNDNQFYEAENWSVRIELANSTTITASRGGSTNSVTVRYRITEYT